MPRNPDDIMDDLLDGVAGDDDYLDGAVGDDDDDEVGARKRRRTGPKVRMYTAPMGFGGAVSIGAAGTHTFQAKVERPAQIRELLITSDNPLSELVVTSFKIGDREQLLTDEISAEFFGVESLQAKFPRVYEALKQASSVFITVRNDGVGASSVLVSAAALIRRP